MARASLHALVTLLKNFRPVLGLDGLKELWGHLTVLHAAAVVACKVGFVDRPGSLGELLNSMLGLPLDEFCVCTRL